MIVIVQDSRDLGMCLDAQRDWFRKHDLDFRSYIRNGIDEEALLAVDDENAHRVVARAHERVRNQT